MPSVKEIVSKAMGKVHVHESQKVIIHEGLYGLEDLKDYYILDYKEGPFFLLQSADMPEIAFIIIDPLYFKKDYKLELSKQDFIDIHLNTEFTLPLTPQSLTPQSTETPKPVSDADEPAIQLHHFVIVTIPEEDPSKMTANLLGPLIINQGTREGKQAISMNPDYTTQHLILEELEKMGEEEQGE